MTGPDIQKAARLLREGNLVSFPTETVYGLGADATSENAVAAIFEAKQRPSFNPLIIHVPDLETAQKFAEFDETAERVANAFWPGALTLVLPRKAESGLSLLVSAGLDTIAIRVPDHPLAQELLRATGKPVAAPSANRSGTISPTQATHVEQSLGDRVHMILDGGPCRVGLESTVIDLTGPKPGLLRPGGLELSEVQKATGPLLHPDQDPAAPKSPGMLASHYAPDCPVRINADEPEGEEAYLGFGTSWTVVSDLNLSPDGNLTEAAANLFAMMRALDNGQYSGIAVAPIPMEGLGLAINDRLKRAAAPKA